MEEIIYNLKLTTSIKNELLRDISNLFKYSSERDKKMELTSSIGDCVFSLMLLCRRYGIDYKDVESCVMDRILNGIAKNELCEEKFGDLSSLAKQIRGNV